MLVKASVYTNYRVAVLNTEVEGVLSILFVHKATEYETLIVSNYLPPSNSEYGKDPDSFFGQLLAICYEFNDVDMIYMCGDYNARIGTCQDVLTNDLVPKRECVDVTVNSMEKAY